MFVRRRQRAESRDTNRAGEEEEEEEEGKQKITNGRGERWLEYALR